MKQRWDGIDEFVAVAMSGSFAGGAKHLSASTSQISRAVARLESHLNTPLFYRTTRSVSLTDTGRVLFERCREVVDQRNEVLDSVIGGVVPQGELRVTCSTAIGARFVAPIIAQMSLEYPKLSINLELSNRIIDLVGEGYDLAIRTGNLSDSRLIATRIASRRLYLCAAPQYLSRVRAPASVADLAGHNCLIGNAATWYFDAGGVEQTFRPKGRWNSNSGEAVLQAALAGLGICQLPEFYVLPFIADGRLEVLLDKFWPDDEPIWAVYPQRKHLLPKVREMIKRLQRELGPAIGI
ncbi:LysR family transcriptional regulator (plasmid) [Sphingomonas paeninsulae]|uniref:LysR family transcriptional regulator n=1 Tax=Sphingomonas paeninsulae TaxID=2319844 RepID=A0A494TCI4_SPHPE|nr:LysR family transcriptional regulator [Sphingomonas paeninsulae]AYJ84964.1 LysR family transcriptional regulator [Sphingomonas paeninsulae]